VRNQAAKPKVLKCAIYTRKSSEEGLEQDFNSLHAQRESCEAYIKSQKHEGWVALPVLYDDGGYSGGSIERPALKKLLTDIQSRAVDVVVVYKVDRLTRSLADFAKIVEIFDAAGVSFVSVTQQFNTTTSMGRLTSCSPLAARQDRLRSAMWGSATPVSARTTGPDPHSFRDLATPRGRLNQGSELSIRTTESNLARCTSELGWIYPVRDGPGRNLCRARFRRCRRGTVGSNPRDIPV
jgi:hypothetical protein